MTKGQKCALKLEIFRNHHMERFELIMILTIIMGLMFFLGWFGSVIYAYFFGKKTGDNKLIKELNQEIYKLHSRNNELSDHYAQGEARWQDEINRLKKENNDFLHTHRTYQDKLFYLEKKLHEERTKGN